MSMIRMALTGLWLCLFALPATAQTCVPTFQPGYGRGSLFPTGVGGGTASIACAEFFDEDGSGPRMFIAGEYFDLAGDPDVTVAKFEGDRWVRVPGIQGRVAAMTVFDLGNGPRLYIAGSLWRSPGLESLGGVASWDGQQWTPLGSAAAGVQSMIGVNTPSGPTIFIGGTNFVHQWNGAWTVLPGVALGGGTSYPGVRALAWGDAGDGPKLYAGGGIYWDAARSQWGVASWNGIGWSWFPGLHYNGSGELTSLEFHQEGGQTALYVGGYFASPTQAGPFPLARLSDGAFTVISGEGSDYRGCAALRSTTSPAGPLLLAALGTDAHRGRFVRAFQGGQWTTLGGGFTRNGSTITDIGAILQPPSLDSVLCFGDFTMYGDSFCPGAAEWNGTTWGAVEIIGIGGYDPVLNPLSGASVYAGPWLLTGSGAVPSDLSMAPSSSAFLNGPAPMAYISDGNNVRANQGTGWVSAPRPGFFGFQVLASRDTGVETLVAYGSWGGSSVPVRRLVSGTWQVIATLPNSVQGTATALCYTEPSGPKLYVAGYRNSTFSGSTLFRLTGATWEPLPLTNSVTSLAEFDVGNGPEMIIGCRAFGTGVGGLYAWNGSSLRDLTMGHGGVPNVTAMSVLNLDGGPQLWCSVDGRLYRWQQQSWVLGSSSSTDAPITRITSIPNDDGTYSMFLGGSFTMAGQELSHRIAELRFCRATCTADFNGDSDFGTDQDIEAFFACLAGNCCGTCGSADFNNDGEFGTDQDIESFFRVLAGHDC